MIGKEFIKINFIFHYSRYLLIIIFLLFCNSLIYNQKKSELEIRRKEKLKEIENVEKLIEKTKYNKEVSINKVCLIKRKIEIRNEIIQNLNNDINEIILKVDILSKEIVEWNNEIALLKIEYSKIIYNCYFRLRNYNYIIFFFSSKSFNQAYRRLLYLKEYSYYRRYLFNYLRLKINNINNKIGKLKFEKNNRQNLLNEKEYESKELEEDKISQKKLIENYSIKENQLKNELKDLQALAKIIENEIEKIIKEEEIRKRSKFNKNKDIILTKNFCENKGKLPWPIENGVVISFFGEHPHPIFKGILVKNNGIDISANCNSNVVCIFDGIVSKIFAIKGANFAVIIRHGDYLTVYQNLEKVNIKVGEQIRINQIIGSSYCENSTNISTLHFEIWNELNKMNPLDWIININ